ncbi:MAG: hypothetical protein NC205_02545 [Prevotella sp.]|nr:hypothetical protein [Alistipes senegalensis]MCM1357447.1 hypothetical protein [Prevotella sp.]MCM1473254.1 hypothetical protein [Muribaculaceae bacterium]
MKKNKFIAVLLAATMSIPTATSYLAVAAEDPLSNYAEIVSEFNKEYGTSYQIATPEQLERIGESTEEIVDLFNEMNEEEFWNYLYDAYSMDLADDSDETSISFNEMNSANIEFSLNSINPSVDTQATYTGTQHFYYRGSDAQSLYITATWSYGDGYYRYSPYLQGSGYTKTEGSYPYYAAYNLSATTQNASREMACSFTCDKYIGNGITDITVYTVNVTFTAGGGDVWRAVSI